MAESPGSKITELEPAITLDGTDLLAIVTNVAVAPDTQKMTVDNFALGLEDIFVASAIKVENEATDATSFPLFVTAPTGDLQPKSNPGLTFNASTSNLTATLIAGISNGNLLDKTATESISGAYTFTNVSTIFSGIDIKDGNFLIINDPGNTNFGLFFHNGTDFGLTFTNTTNYALTNATNYKFDNSIFITEKAAANADFITLGQFWVRNDVPNTPMFTDDAGTDFELNDSLAATITVENESVDTTCFPLFVTAATGELGPKSNANLTFDSATGAFGCAGFTSTGIDDNATQEIISIGDTTLDIGPASGSFSVFARNTSGGIQFSGGTSGAGGSSMFLTGATQTGAGDIIFTDVNIVTQLHYDDSASLWDFQANDVTTTGSVTGQTGIFTSTAHFADDVLTVDSLFRATALTGTEPTLQFDTNDRITYDRTVNKFIFTLGGFDHVEIDNNGRIDAVGITLGTTAIFANNSGAGGLTVPDQFFAHAANSTTPSITVDSGDRFTFDRTNNRFEFEIGFTNSLLTLEDGLADFNGHDVTTTGAFIGSASDVIITGTTHTLVAANNGRNLVFTNAAAIAVTLPDGLAVTFHCTLIQTTVAGIPTVTPSGSDTLNGVGTGLAPAAQWMAMYINKWDSGVWFGLV